MRPSVEELAATLPGTITLECDVSNDAHIDAVAQQLAAKWGSLEMFVHGVAFARKEDLEGSFVATPREGFQLALDVSAYSFINVTNRMLPLLEKNGASLVTLTYLAAERAVKNYNVMGSAKAVLEQSTRQMALELGSRRIRVNCISAGAVSTLAARGVRGFTDMLKEYAGKAPLGRGITKEDVGSAGLFLLSDMAGGITGTTLYVDAGWHILGM
jgi:enoyl-[acyl-carrier protein] reductase I